MARVRELMNSIGAYPDPRPCWVTLPGGSFDDEDPDSGSALPLAKVWAAMILIVVGRHDHVSAA